MTDQNNRFELFELASRKLDEGFEFLPASDAEFDLQKADAVLLEAAERMWDNYPYHHPLYAGQMLKPPHPVARTAYMMAMEINPNNHALDGGKASSAMEKEAVAEIAEMFSWQRHLGHLTSGGTMANLEALWIASQLNPGKRIVASSQAHYTHGRISNVLGIAFDAIACDQQARMDIAALESELQKGDVGTVVVTLGTTGVGSVDPLDKVLALREQYPFRVHVDAAYGGYYMLVDSISSTARLAYDAIHQVDSIVIDPHKHGLQPYGCGCVLFRDPSVGKYYKHDSPYTYFTSNELHLGEISLECSRAGASAVALWATQEYLPLECEGQFAQNLAKSREAARILFSKLNEDARFLTPLAPDLDIVIWAPYATSTSEISALSNAFFQRAEELGLYLASFSYPSQALSSAYPSIEIDSPMTTCLRSCLMKPEHLDWVERIWDIIDQVQSDL